MKKNLFMVAAVALMALVSCNKEELGNNSNGVVFVAELEQDASTKTTLGADRKAHWEVNDAIKINGTVFTANEVGPESSFTTTAENFDVTATTFRAVYPASSYISTTAVDIPANQDGLFASASIAVAESSDQYLKFQNLSSILKFQVPVACSEVKIESSASLAGRITVNYSNGDMTPDYAGVTQPSKTIKVTGSFVPKTDYYVAVKPATHTLTVSIDGNVSKASTKLVTLERSKIYDLGVLPEPVVPDPVYIYVKNDMGWSTVNIYGFEKANDKNLFTAAWPGTKMTVTETVNGNSFFKFELPADYVGKEIGLTFNNGSRQLSDLVITPSANTYVRLTTSGPICIDPAKVSSFKYRIYVLAEDGLKDIQIYNWNAKTPTASYPGTKLTLYKEYYGWNIYYYEIPENEYASGFNFLLNIGGDSFKSANYSWKSSNGDLYYGCWKNNGQQGWYATNASKLL